MSRPVRTVAWGVAEDGFALFAVMIFAVVVGISGIAFFSMASYEFKGAEDRQRSSEAFYLADGSIEAARGAFLEDQTWRGPITQTDLGDGSYTLSVRDTVVSGGDAVLLHGEAVVGESSRNVETLATVEPLLEVMPVFAGRNFTASGNLTVTGQIHVNGNADFGSNDIHLKAGTHDEGYVINPPAVYTDPEYFPNATFYRVIGTSESPARARVFHYDQLGGVFVPDTTEFGPSIVSFDGTAYTFTFAGTKLVDNFKTVGNSTFRLNNSAGHDYVVVDFGHPNDAAQHISNVVLTHNTGFVLEATIVNARFEGSPDPGSLRRVEACGGWWVGGNVKFERVDFAPRGCVALVSHSLGPLKPGTRGALGTPARPALTYVTGNVGGFKEAEVHGALVALCDVATTGGDIFYDPSFLDCMSPGVLGDGGAGFLKFLEWREVTP